MTKTDRDAAKSFGAFLKEHRLKYGVTLEQLSDGLCSASGLARIESGTRTAGKALQGSLLYRLGISPDTYEHFLFEEDYLRWKKRQQLLYAVSRRDVEEAGRRLGEYRAQYEEGVKADVDRRLERQFCLSMEAQILQGKEIPGYFPAAPAVAAAENPSGQGLQEKLGDLYREALELTVSFPASVDSVFRQKESNQKTLYQTSLRIRDKICSVQELNLLLEALHYGQCGNAGLLYKEILGLTEDARFDSVSRAKVYAKAVYYFCLDGLALGTWGLAEKAEAIVWCTKAVECLREAGRMYYLWELLGLFGGLMQDVAAGQRAAGAEARAQELEKQIQEYREWGQALEAVYEEFGVPKETEDFCWLYVEKEVYCINEIVRKRRTMLGISRKKLCGDGILCSEKTLRRLEEEGRRVQKGILNELMKRLNLSAEYCQTELVTSDPEVLRMMSHLRDCIREHDTEGADRLLGQLRERISLDIPSNRQEWMGCHALNEVQKGTINREQCVERLREALCCTLPYEIAVKSGEKYLTNKEINCIQNMVCENKGMDDEKKRQIAMLEERYQICEKDKNIFCFINMYEIVMGCVASELGNMGEYDHSDEISRKIITECLYLRRTFGVHRGIYNLIWNDGQRQKEGIPFQRRYPPREDLKRCIIFSRLGKERRPEQFYSKKLQSLEKE